MQVTKYSGLAALNRNNVPSGFHLHKEFGQLTSCEWTGFEYRTWNAALTEEVQKSKLLEVLNVKCYKDK